MREKQPREIFKTTTNMKKIKTSTINVRRAQLEKTTL
jgi:hypothetical protein